MPHLDSSASGGSASGAAAPLHLIQSLASTPSANPDTDPLRSRETAADWLRTAGLLPAEAGLTTSEHAALLRLRTSIRDVLTVGPAGTVRLASAARASYPNLVAEIAIAMAESAASGTWPRPGQDP